jgi:endonuclease/exonuclease/phosphatase family metal-dependent hydrolase
MKILFSNLGYARGISGKLSHHAFYLLRHLYCSRSAQNKTLIQLNTLIARENPDICCFVEIDKGSFNSAGMNQLDGLTNSKYTFSHIENKYGVDSPLRSFFITKGKSNGFMAKRDFHYERLYFRHGIKRLIYKIHLSENVALFFTHLSLNKSVRLTQLQEVFGLMREARGEAILLGDFNLLSGLGELDPLLDQSGFILLNQVDTPTFLFHKRRLVLDVAICTRGIAARSSLKVVPQPYSDHAALVLDIHVPDRLSLHDKTN